MTINSNGEAEFDVVVVGGGPGGLSAALYTTRLGHDTAMVDRGGGRAAMMVDTHNVIGIPEEVSGTEFLETSLDQLRAYGTEIIRGFVTAIDHNDGDRRFRVSTADSTYEADRIVLATGFTDERPDPPLPRTGRGLHYCLHCDAYMFVDEPVYVMGHDDAAAHVAMIMLNFTDRVDLLLRGASPTWSDETDEQLRAHPVTIIDAEIAGMEKHDDGWLKAFEFDDGTTRPYKGGFAMYGAEYNHDLARDLGAEINDDGTVHVDDKGRTTVDGVFAVGDLTPGHNQIPIAIGEGAEVGITIHMDLREFPKSLEDLDREGGIDPADVPAIPRSLRDRAQAHSGTADD